MRGVDPESDPIEVAEDRMLNALFKVAADPQFELRGHAKSQHSIFNS